MDVIYLDYHKLAFVLFPATLLGVLPVSLYLHTCGIITVAQAALSVTLAMSMVTSLSKLEVFSNDINQMKNTILELQDYLEMSELSELTENASITIIRFVWQTYTFPTQVTRQMKCYTALISIILLILSNTISTYRKLSLYNLHIVSINFEIAIYPARFMAILGKILCNKDVRR